MVSKIRIILAVTKFIFYSLLFVVPPVAIIYFSEQNPMVQTIVTQMNEALSLDIKALAFTIAISGIVVAIASLVSTLTNPWSLVNLAANIITSISELFIFLLLIGLGDASSLGYFTKVIKIGEFTINLTFDFKFFAVLMIGATVLGIVSIFLRYLIERKEKQQLLKKEVT